VPPEQLERQKGQVARRVDAQAQAGLDGARAGGREEVGGQVLRVAAVRVAVAVVVRTVVVVVGRRRAGGCCAGGPGRSGVGARDELRDVVEGDLGARAGGALELFWGGLSGGWGDEDDF
jgi:hypothetical protein